MTVLSARDLENREMIKPDYLASLTWGKGGGERKNPTRLIRLFVLSRSRPILGARTGERCLRRYSEVVLEPRRLN